VVSEVSKIKLGLPELEETQMGSLIDRTHQARQLAAIETAHAEGAKLLVGGAVPTDPELARGAYLEPTVFDDVTSEMDISRTELFGPVLAVVACDDADEMLRTANDTDYGLTASIWTTDISRALRTAEEIEAGYVWINDVETRYPGVPHGGWKLSGIGQENALVEELATFTRSKSVNIAIGGR
jgi:acyl-CoA reductase-like NAD-dependent aldehyde dehydrogenase